MLFKSEETCVHFFWGKYYKNLHVKELKTQKAKIISVVSLVTNSSHVITTTLKMPELTEYFDLKAQKTEEETGEEHELYFKAAFLL